MFLNGIEGLENFETAVRNNDIVGVLLVIITVLITVVIILYNLNDKNTKKFQDEIKSMNDTITKKEEERLKKAVESEKEMIEVLNGVSTIIKMGDQADKYQNEKILSAIKNLGERIMDKLESIKKIN